MRLCITLEPHENLNLNLPVHYNHMVQGFVYSQLEPNLANWLHGEAYHFAKRTYKMFTFSRLTGKYNLDKRTKRITFMGPVSFKLASYNTDVLASLAEHLLTSDSLRLGNTHVQVSGVEILTPPNVCVGAPTRVRALSPITIYSTFEKPGGGKLTHYYAPREKGWGDMILGNLARKARSLEWNVNPDEALQDAYIKPFKVSDRDKKVVRYKNFVMEAWLGTYELKLPEGFFELAYDVGLGGKNAQGMGMVEICRP